MGTTARLLERAGTRTVWLELDYDGLDPPSALFADLALLGWRPPAAATPPHDAIDWATPDLERGLHHTVRPWRVVGAAVGPPAGSGPRGAWTDTDEPTFLQLLHRVLERHQVEVAASGPDPTHQRTGGATTASPARAKAAPAAPEGADHTTAPHDRPGSEVLLTLVVEAEQAQAVREQLEASTLPFRTTNATLTVSQRYRGRAFVTEVDGVRFEVAAHEGSAEQLRRNLAALGVDERLARLTIEPLEPSGHDDPELAEVHPFRSTRGVA